MQSQQKRVKWSRGETAEALEERTDTGITQASVELMENCIPDIYGNISRRPAIVPLPVEDRYTDKKSTGDSFYYLFGFSYDEDIQFAVFYITQDDYVIIGLYPHKGPEFIRIRDNWVVGRYDASDSDCYTGVQDAASNWKAQPISYAQQNNYLVLATATNVWKIQLTNIQDFSFIPSIELWKFSAGWYAPEGTQTRKVNSSMVSGLNFNGGFSNYAFTDDISSVIYSEINTGVGYTYADDLYSFIPVGSIIQMPNIGCYFRVEGYRPSVSNVEMLFQDTIFDGVLNINDSVPSVGTYCKIRRDPAPISELDSSDNIVVYKDGVQSDFYSTRLAADGQKIIVRNSGSSTGLSETTVSLLYKYMVTPTGSRRYVSGSTCSSWAETPATSIKIMAYGELLTPVADSSASDSEVSVEYDYKSLQPESWSIEGSYPHPQKLAFNGQRLWAGGWAQSLTEQYALVVGSQIARYNDLKNNYNQENEPVTLDILTKFKEKVLHIVDYNGLKVFTDAYEYTYNAVDGLVKQSSNGAYERCEPLVFESLCLYVDSTGKQVKAMQYEFQSNIFNSSSINQLAPAYLVWYPIAMAAYEDKQEHTGKYLFVLNGYEQGISPVRLSVCNFVPSNQANIWSRWTFPKLSSSILSKSRLCGLVNTKTEPIFMLYARVTASSSGVGPETETLLSTNVIIPAKLTRTLIGGAVAIPDYATRPSASGQMVFASVSKTDGYETTVFKTVLSNVDVAVYANGEYQFTTRVNQLGYIEDDISQLTNVQVGYMVNSRIVSHPIDVGGKTKSIKKRIGKAQMSVHNTDAGAITINGKTGYMNPAKDHICFYGVTGMKNEIKYTITNNNGAMFHLESLLMNIEYGTLIS